MVFTRFYGYPLPSGAVVFPGGGIDTPTISGSPPAITAGSSGSYAFTVAPPGTPVTILVTRDGSPDTLAAHNVAYDGFGGLTWTGAAL